jgi:EmrB/QacA subfamily drug resistance transporter
MPSQLPPLARFALIAGPMIYMVDSSVVNVAVPAIARDLSSPVTTVQWTVSGYLLTTAAGLAASAWLARRFGTLRAYAVSMVGFTLASVACAFAPTVQVLITTRCLQGLLGAQLVPLSLGMLLGRSGAMRHMPASIGMIFFVAPALGPAVGGVLVGTLGWPSVFWINAPIGMLAVAGLRSRGLSALGLGGSRDARLDLPGLSLLATALMTATFGASEGAERGWLGWYSLPWWLAAIPLVVAYFAWARRLRARGGIPAVDVTLLADARLRLSVALCGMSGAALFSLEFLTPIFLQQVQGHSATAVGLTLMPQGVAMGLATGLGRKAIERGAVRASVIAGMALLGTGMLGLLLITRTTPLPVTAMLLCGRGVALGLIVPPLFGTLLGDLEPGRAADANTLVNSVERMAGAFGVALLATFYQQRTIATGSGVTALHQSAMLLATVAGAGALAALRLGGRQAGAGGGSTPVTAASPGEASLDSGHKPAVTPVPR